MNITDTIQHKYALSHQGAIDMEKAFASCTVSNIALMIPVGILYTMCGDLFDGTLPQNKIIFYLVGCIVCLALIALTTRIQYHATFYTTYIESGIRRRALAEKLRKLPLSFFGKKDLANLTHTIMSDCALIETASSHWLPELVGAMISTVIVVIGLFFVDWRLALAATWVMPVSFYVVLTSKSRIGKMNQRASQYNVACEEGIQEALETLRDLKAYNAQDTYLDGLNSKIKRVEKHSLVLEFSNAAYVASAQMFLKLGIGTVTVVGSGLLVCGKVDILTFFM